MIETALPNDLAAVHELETAAFPAPWRAEFFETELRSENRLSLVARRDRTVVGYLFAMWFFDEMHVNKIAVQERERRRGIALALMHTCTDFARRRGVKTISLEVRQSNEVAQQFYRRLGFKPLYVRPRYYPDGESAVFMTREIDAA